MEEGTIKKQIILSGILVAVISGILMFIGCVVYGSIKGAQEKEAQKYMREVVSQYRSIITAQIDGDLQTLDALAAFVGQDETVDFDFILPRLEVESRRNDFVRMGFISTDRKGYLMDTNGEKRYDIDLSDEDFIQETLSGKPVVSEITEDRFSGETVVFYGVPVTHNGNIVGAITATRLASGFSEIISGEIFGGAAYIHVVDSQGNFILRSEHAVIDRPLDNVFDDGEIAEQTRLSILSDMARGGDSFATFRFRGNDYWATFIPVGINDWQIFCLVSHTFLNHNFSALFTVCLCVMACILALFVVLFLYIYSILKKGEKTLQVLAYKDILTGADNRNRFVKDLPDMLQEPWDHAMVLMNITGFKFVNEFFGFERGDLLLKHIADVFHANIKEGERFYRDSAEHFGMLTRYDSKEALIAGIQKIQSEINAYTVSPNQDYRINCNFGIHIIRAGDAKANGLSPDAVINGAQLALDSVKGNTAILFAFYDETIHEKARKKTEIESQMHSALSNGEFHMYLQPKYYLSDPNREGPAPERPAQGDTVSGGPVLHSAEALVRWYSGDGTIHYPDEFIPVFEENGFITELDMYMLEEACRKVSYWIRQGYKAVPISVNQSRIFFYDEEYLNKFHQIVDRYHIDPSLIILEVTESVAMSNLEQVKMVIKKLHHMGFSISMDDFGSGYSSLNTLKDLDMAELKLDKEFLSEQSTSPRGKVVIESMIHLAKSLSITTVAEGIENEMQLEFLRSISCDIGQGYYFAKPMPIEEFEQSILQIT